MKTISIVTPCYNEELNIRECHARVAALFDGELKDYRREHVFCDNASSDRSVEILREIAAADPCVKVILNARNFGPMRSNFNGVMAASGDADPPVPARRSAGPARAAAAIREAVGGRKRDRLRHSQDSRRECDHAHGARALLSRADRPLGIHSAARRRRFSARRSQGRRGDARKSTIPIPSCA